MTELSAKVLTNERYILAQIPFNIEGANLCEFRSAFSRDRIEYMRELAQISRELTRSRYQDRSRLLERYNDLYERNMSYAQKGLGKSLEVSFKAFIEKYYHELKPRERHLFFNINKLDIIILGHYSLSPRCNGQVNVNLELIDKNGSSTSYQASGAAHTVMSKLASQIFERFQRTQFPTTIYSQGKQLEILGGANNDISWTRNLEEAKYVCESLQARLPSLKEYKLIDTLGSWSGGITLENKAWAMNYPNVYLYKTNRSPVTNIQFLKPGIDIYYVCVR